MTKISFDSQEQQIQVTRNLGKTGEGQITINREGGAGINIDLGFGSIGATTDYGGAISLGLLGQEIVWGREGGTIYIQIGGFEVFVEAVDCIVTEIKTIFGNIVAQRSYPDPGCKPPEEPEPPDPPELPPPSPGGIDPATMTSEKLCYALVGADRATASTTGIGNSNKTTTQTSTKITASNVPEFVPEFSRILPFDAVCRVTFSGTIEIFRDGVWLPGANQGEFTSLPNYASKREVFHNNSRLVIILMTLPSGEPVRSSPTGVATGSLGFQPQTTRSVIYGKENIIGDYITRLINGDTDLNYQTPYTSSSHKANVSDIIYVGKRPTKKPIYPPTGNKPPMRDCCEEILDYLADFEEVFDVQRLLKDKFPVSSTFMAPQCDPASKTNAKSYYEIMQCIFRTLAHGLIFEPRVSVKDADAAKAGDQSFSQKYLNATGWASAVSEALLEVRDDGNVSTNMDIRNGFAVTQSMVGISDAVYRLEAILDALGVELIPKVAEVQTPYNLQIKTGKGFGTENERQIDLNADEATEKLLPALLQTKKNKIKTVEVHPRSRSILEVLENIEANLLANNGG